MRAAITLGSYCRSRRLFGGLRESTKRQTATVTQPFKFKCGYIEVLVRTPRFFFSEWIRFPQPAATKCEYVFLDFSCSKKTKTRFHISETLINLIAESRWLSFLRDAFCSIPAKKTHRCGRQGEEGGLTPLSLKPQSRFGDKPFKFQVVCPQNGTAVLKVLSIDEVRQTGSECWP